jgi:hypothetical protein
MASVPPCSQALLPKITCDRYVDALSAAIQARHYGIVDAILSVIPCHSTSVLWFAASKGQPTLASIALKYGAYIHAKCQKPGEDFDKTALVLASEKNHYAVIRIIMEAIIREVPYRSLPPASLPASPVEGDIAHTDDNGQKTKRVRIA